MFVFVKPEIIPKRECGRKQTAVSGLFCQINDSINDSRVKYMMACYYFAGFDNTAVMVVMNLTSTDNVRTRKKRLRQKIAGFGKVGEEFLRYF